MELIRGGGCALVDDAHPQKLGPIGTGKVNPVSNHEALSFPLECSIKLFCHTIPDITSNEFFHALFIALFYSAE